MLSNVSLNPRANVYFNGKCVSHSFVTASGETKSAGVILPSTLTFNTSAPEIMEVVEGSCEVTMEDGEAVKYSAGEKFSVAANSSFTVKVDAPFHYICHFG
jgi:purine/pyrimidine-nucleoside phosphorylase